jgi:hypothetical protein
LKSIKNAKGRKLQGEEEEGNDDDDEKNEEGCVGRRGSVPFFLFFFHAEKKHLEKFPKKTLPRAHTSPLY